MELTNHFTNVYQQPHQYQHVIGMTGSAGWHRLALPGLDMDRLQLPVNTILSFARLAIDRQAGLVVHFDGPNPYQVASQVFGLAVTEPEQPIAEPLLLNGPKISTYGRFLINPYDLFEKTTDNYPTTDDKTMIIYRLSNDRHELAYDTLRCFANGRIVVNETTQTVDIDEVNVNVNTTEFRLLNLFAKHPGRIFSSSQLYNQIYDDVQLLPNMNSVEVLISKLRKKLGDPALSNKKIGGIQTVIGQGYRSQRYIRPVGL
jgi:DNA-binding winged helix-turn-helix (wHTH) protein